MENDNIIHNFDSKSSDETKKIPENPLAAPSKKIPIILFVILAFLGAATGFVIVQTQGSLSPGTVGVKTTQKKGQVVGLKDEKTFKDSTEGTLREGGIDGEGAYHLERPGGISQNVYLTSSVIDLSAYIGKKVKVWGETFEGEKAGWLMDVGKLQVL